MIRPTFLAFETAKRALSISQAGLDIVGHNISNAQTTGYTRQRVDQVSMSMNGISSKYQTFGGGAYGSGAILNGVSQIRDPYLDNRFRTEATKSGELGIKSEGLTDINNIFDETLADGLSKKMSELLNSLTVLGQSANIKEHAAVFRETADAFVSILNKDYTQLEEARALQFIDLKTTAEQDVNAILSKIADLNKKIKEDNFYNNPSNELNDERNMLIDNLAEYFDINVVRTPTQVSEGFYVETVSIELRNSGDPPLMLVEGGFHNKIGVTEDPSNGNAIVTLLDGISGLPMEDLTTKLSKGGIKGYIDIINGEGPNSGGANSFRGIPYYMKALDEYAQQFAEILNRVNNISDQESKDSAVSYKPVLSGTATDWLSSIKYGNIEGTDYGSLDLSGKNTNMSFAYDEVSGIITAKYTDENGVEQTLEADYTASPPSTEIEFRYTSGPVGVAFTAELDDVVGPADSSEVLIDAGWPAIPGTDGNKNLIVPVSPKVTDSTGGQPGWIESVKGGVIQFSGKEYGVTFAYNSTTNAMTATMADGTQYNGTYSANGKVDFRDDSGAVMFTVKTTNEAPPASTATTVDATITAKNISISQNWFEDALYLTTTKSNASNMKQAALALEGTNNPTWLNKVAMGPDTVTVPNGSYQFELTGNADSDGNKEICVTISGIDYKGYYKTNSTIELTGGVPPKVGLIIETNSKAFGLTKAENVATIRNDTGAANDNINKLLTEMHRNSNYSVSGINGSLQTFLTSLQAQMGLDKNTNDSTLEASLTVISTLANRRDSVSAVSVDEEGINMMTYQNYYNAAARYMTTIDEALDKVINGMGTVGR